MCLAETDQKIDPQATLSLVGSGARRRVCGLEPGWVLKLTSESHGEEPYWSLRFPHLVCSVRSHGVDSVHLLYNDGGHREEEVAGLCRSASRYCCMSSPRSCLGPQNSSSSFWLPWWVPCCLRLPKCLKLTMVMMTIPRPQALNFKPSIYEMADSALMITSNHSNDNSNNNDSLVIIMIVIVIILSIRCSPSRQQAKASDLPLSAWEDGSTTHQGLEFRV